MALSRNKLLFHPVRSRILRALHGKPLTTQGVTQVLGDVPQSTIYRHLKLLLEANMIEVVDTREINGITEKYYGHNQNVNLTAEEFAALSIDDHRANLEQFALALLQTSTSAIERAGEAFDPMTLSYREYSFHTTEEEFLKLRRAIFKLLRDAEKNSADTPEDQRHYKVNITTHQEP